MRTLANSRPATPSRTPQGSATALCGSGHGPLKPRNRRQWTGTRQTRAPPHQASAPQAHVQRMPSTPGKTRKLHKQPRSGLRQGKVPANRAWRAAGWWRPEVAQFDPVLRRCKPVGSGSSTEPGHRHGATPPLSFAPLASSIATSLDFGATSQASPFFLAQAKGGFKDEGLDVSEHRCGGRPSCRNVFNTWPHPQPNASARR